MKEYRIVGGRDELKTADELQRELNGSAADGWRPILMSGTQPSAAHGIVLCFVLEREKSEEAPKKSTPYLYDPNA